MTNGVFLTPSAPVIWWSNHKPNNHIASRRGASLADILASHTFVESCHRSLQYGSLVSAINIKGPLSMFTLKNPFTGSPCDPVLYLHCFAGVCYPTLFFTHLSRLHQPPLTLPLPSLRPNIPHHLKREKDKENLEGDIFIFIWDKYFRALIDYREKLEKKKK